LSRRRPSWGPCWHCARCLLCRSSSRAALTGGQENRGQQQELAFLDETRVVLRYLLPLAETVASDFHDRLKSVSHGYASFDYEEAPYQPAVIAKVELLLNNEPVDALSFVAHRDRAVVCVAGTGCACAG
jgi:GTP-binding protein LepA